MKKLSLFCLISIIAVGCAQYDGNGNPPGPDGGPTTDVSYIVARSCGADCLEINGLYCDSDTAQLVGDGAAEGIKSWYSGPTLTKQANGWFKYQLTGQTQEMHLTLYGCGNNPNSCEGGSTWADYGCNGSPAAPGTHAGGDYEYCGSYLGGPYTCNIGVIRNPGSDPQPRGIIGGP